METRRPVAAIVVSGVSGSGKSTVGRALARELEWDFCDADDLHSPENVAKMRSGEPLTEADREPWLERVAEWIGARTAESPAVLACSALRRAHRDRLRSAGREVWFVALTPPVDILRERVAARRGHFMPPTLLASQLAALEPLAQGEPGFTVEHTGSVEQVVGEILAAARRTAGGTVRPGEGPVGRPRPLRGDAPDGPRRR